MSEPGAQTIDASWEAAQPATGSGFSDALTVGFADPDAHVYGLVRVALAQGTEVGANALVVLFSGREPVTVQIEGAQAPARADLGDLAVAGVRMRTNVPLRSWQLAFRGAQASFALDLSASSRPLVLDSDSAVGDALGMRGYEQVCHMRGTVTIAGRTRELSGWGQRGHAWGVLDWQRLALTRAVSAWLTDGSAIVLAAARPAAARGHGEEALSAFRVPASNGPDAAENAAAERAATAGAVTAGVVTEPVHEARLSTSYDAAGHHVRAGLEIWPGPDTAHPLRAAGEVLCGTTLELGQLRYECAFFAWRCLGRDGAGRYDIVHRA